MTASFLKDMSVESEDKFAKVFGSSRGRVYTTVYPYIQEVANELCAAARAVWDEVGTIDPAKGQGARLVQRSIEVQQALKQLDASLLQERGYGFRGDDFESGLLEYFASTSTSDFNTVNLSYHNELTQFTFFGLKAGNLLMNHDYAWEDNDAKYEWKCRFTNLTTARIPGLDEFSVTKNPADDTTVISLARDTSIDPEDTNAALNWLHDIRTLQQAMPLAQEKMAKRYRLFMNCNLGKHVKKGW